MAFSGAAATPCASTTGVPAASAASALFAARQGWAPTPHHCACTTAPSTQLANHGGEAHNTTFLVSQDRRSFELRAVEAIPAGGEALITYGEGKPNAELLRDYGGGGAMVGGRWWGGAMVGEAWCMGGL